MNTSAGVDLSHNSSSRPKTADSGSKIDTPTTFIPHLRESRRNGSLDISRFRIPTTKAPPLEKPSKSESATDTAKVNSSSTPHDNSSCICPLSSPLDSPADNIKKTMDLPEHKLYSEAVVSQMLSLRIQQEITKQTQEKIELAKLITQLMKNAEAHGMESQLIQRLFLDDDRDSCKSKISRLRQGYWSHSPRSKSTPESSLDCPKHNEKSKSVYLSPKEAPVSVISPPQKREGNNDNSVETAGQVIKTPSDMDSQKVEPLAPPKPAKESEIGSSLSTQIPLRRMTMERIPERTPERESTKTTSAPASESGVTPRSTTGTTTHSSISLSSSASGATSPSIARPHMSPAMPPITPSVYPYYYHFPSDLYGHPAGHLVQQSSGLGIECSDHSPPHYTHQCPSHAFSSSPHSSFSAPTKDSHLSQGNHSSSGRSEHDQKLQPIYQLNRSPQSVLPGQAYLPQRYYAPPLTAGVPPLFSLGSVPWESAPITRTFEKRNSQNEDSHAAKKHRGSKTEISFMISTPSNPPARKYNKPHGEK